MTNATLVNRAHHQDYINCAGMNVPPYFSLDCLIWCLERRRFRLDFESDVIAAYWREKENGHVQVG